MKKLILDTVLFKLYKRFVTVGKFQKKNNFENSVSKIPYNFSQLENFYSCHYFQTNIQNLLTYNPDASLESPLS